MILHLVLNSFIVFIILTFSVEFSLFIFKIAHPRIRYICRLLPILKIPFDLIIFESYGESLFINFNPFSCEMYVQEFINNLISSPLFSTTSNAIISHHLAAQISPLWLNVFIFTIIFFFTMILLKKVFLFIKSRAYLNKILSSSVNCNKLILNKNILDKLKQLKVIILISDKVHIPFAANLHYIIIPKHLIADLSQNEFEAIIVHELEHLRWKDPVLKMLSTFICSLFWWLPSTWWLKQLEQEQEEGCDLQIHKYGVDAYALATAMVKVAKKAKYLRCELSAISLFNSPKNNYFKRLKNILDPNQPSLKKIYCWQHVSGLIICFLTFSCFWMC